MFPYCFIPLRIIFAIFLVLILIVLPMSFVVPETARGQTDAHAEIASIDAQDFPQVSALVDVYDANGEFTAGLQPNDLTAYEDGQPRPVDTLVESATPVQIVVAINPGPGLAVRDGNAVQRFTHVVG